MLEWEWRLSSWWWPKGDEKKKQMRSFEERFINLRNELNVIVNFLLGLALGNCNNNEHTHLVTRKNILIRQVNRMLSNNVIVPLQWHGWKWKSFVKICQYLLIQLHWSSLVEVGGIDHRWKMWCWCPPNQLYSNLWSHLTDFKSLENIIIRAV